MCFGHRGRERNAKRRRGKDEIGRFVGVNACCLLSSSWILKIHMWQVGMLGMERVMGRCLVSEKEERKDVDKEMGKLREIDRKSRFWGIELLGFYFYFYFLNWGRKIWGLFVCYYGIRVIWNAPSHKKSTYGMVELLNFIAEIYLLYWKRPCILFSVSHQHSIYHMQFI